MEYISTLKQFHLLNKTDFDASLEQKKKSPDTLLFGFKIHGYNAFFHYDHVIFEKVINVETKNVKLNSIFESLPQIARNQYIRNTLVAEVKNTNELEGVFSSRKEIFELTEDLKKRNSDKIGSIVNKYLLLLNNKEEKEIVSCKDIRSIYDALFNVGNKSLIAEKDMPDGIYFRKNFVGVFDGLGNLIHKGLSGENAIIEAIQESLAILNNNDINLYVRLAIFHYIFEYVHPFYDGNGRIGRYLISSVIKKEKSDIFAFRVSSGINIRKNKYYKAFKDTEDVRNCGDLGTFVYEFLDIFEKEYDKSIEYAIEKQKLLNKYCDDYIESGKKFSKNEKNILFVLIQARVFSDFGVSVNEICKATNSSSKTVRRSILKFKQMELVVEEKYGKTNYYNLKV